MSNKVPGFGTQPEFFMPSSKVIPTRLEGRIDLVPAANPPTYGGGRYIPFTYKVPKGQALIVQGIVCLLWRRLNIGSAEETFGLVGNDEAAGKVVFSPVIQGAAAFQYENKMNYPVALAQAGTQQNVQLRSSGITSVSSDPDSDVMRMWGNPLFTFVVRTEQTLQVLFEVLPGINELVISDDPNEYNRIDFAGAVLVGELIADNDYSALVKEL